MNRVVVDVLDFLSHHFIVEDKFRMTSFLPDLELTILLVPSLEEFQLFQPIRTVSGTEFVDNTPRCEGLEVTDLLAQVIRHRNEMQMIFHDHVRENLHPLLLLKKSPGFEKDRGELRISEERDPTYHRTSQKIRFTGVIYFVSGSAHGTMYTRNATVAFPTRSVGKRIQLLKFSRLDVAPMLRGGARRPQRFSSSMSLPRFAWERSVVLVVTFDLLTNARLGAVEHFLDKLIMEIVHAFFKTDRVDPVEEHLLCAVDVLAVDVV